MHSTSVGLSQTWMYRLMSSIWSIARSIRTFALWILTPCAKSKSSSILVRIRIETGDGAVESLLCQSSFLMTVKRFSVEQKEPTSSSMTLWRTEWSQKLEDVTTTRSTLWCSRIDSTRTSFSQAVTIPLSKFGIAVLWAATGQLASLLVTQKASQILQVKAMVFTSPLMEKTSYWRSGISEWLSHMIAIVTCNYRAKMVASTTGMEVAIATWISSPSTSLTNLSSRSKAMLSIQHWSAASFHPWKPRVKDTYTQVHQTATFTSMTLSRVTPLAC